MKRLLLATFTALAGLAWAIVPTHAAQPTNPDWQTQDMGVYVVSTINVLHPIGGLPAARAFHDRLGVTQYAVFADQAWHDHYFIALQRSSGLAAGALVYALGWTAPRSVTVSTDRLGIVRAHRPGRRAYRQDPKLLLGIYGSTLPA